jgi:hypothetical protein
MIGLSGEIPSWRNTTGPSLRFLKVEEGGENLTPRYYLKCHSLATSAGRNAALT